MSASTRESAAKDKECCKNIGERGETRSLAIPQDDWLRIVYRSLAPLPFVNTAQGFDGEDGTGLQWMLRACTHSQLKGYSGLHAVSSI